MKLHNASKNGLCHNVSGKIYKLPIGATVDVPDEIAEIWLKIDGISEYVEPEDMKKLQEEIKKIKKSKKGKND